MNSSEDDSGEDDNLLGERLAEMRLAAFGENEQIYQDIPQLTEILDNINSEEASRHLTGVRTLRQHLSSEEDLSCHGLLENEAAVDKIVGFLKQTEDAELRYETAWVTTNILSGHSGETECLVEAGIVPPLIDLLSANEERLQEQACWALANIMGDCSQARDEVVSAGLVAPLIRLIESKPANQILDGISLIIVNLFRENDPSVSMEITKQILPYIKQFSTHEYETLIPHAIWALSYVVEESENKCKLVIEDEDIIKQLLKFLESSDLNVLIPSLRCFVNLATGLRPLPQCILDCGVIELLPNLLKHEDVKIRRQAVFFVNDVSTGPDRHLEALVEVGVLPCINEVMERGDRIEKKEAFWVIPNFIITRKHQLKQAIVENCLESFVNLSDIGDPEIVEYLLMAVRDLLYTARYTPNDILDFADIKTRIERSGGLKKIENLQKSNFENLQKMSYQIIDHFFWGNEKKYQMEGENLCAQLQVGDDVAGDEAKAVASGSLIGGLKAISPGLQAGNEERLHQD